MRKKSITFVFIPLFLIFSVGLQSSDCVSVQPYIATDTDNTLTTAANWSNATVISDDNTNWNDGSSFSPDIAIDADGNVYVVWYDHTDGEWGIDQEIMYTKHTSAGWSNATVISDDETGWNIGDSSFPCIAIDDDGNIHVVWHDTTNGEWGVDVEIMYANYTGDNWSNATVISDIYGWNDGNSYSPDIAIDGYGNIHMVWYDYTIGEWGGDGEIMYSKYNAAGWSNATVISDIYGWNDGNSINPSIAVDGDGNAHVVWEDDTNGEWGTDQEIMYSKHTAAGWSNATVISDDGTEWNDADSYSPNIAIDGDGNIYVVWYDKTIGEWGTDQEIMFTKNTATGWETTIISDIYGWNDGNSQYPDIVIDGDGNVHVVWYDYTNGQWGTDAEIMYVNRIGTSWSNATVISDDATGWNDAGSYFPSIAIDGDGYVHVVWRDGTNGEWGADDEIMYSKNLARETSDSDEPINIVIVPSQDSSISLLSPLGLIIMASIAIITSIIVSTIITKSLGKGNNHRRIK